MTPKEAIQKYRETVATTRNNLDVLEMMRLTQIHIGFCGHVHEKWKFMETEQGLIVNVGVDQWNFYPVDQKQIFKAIKREGL